MAARCHTQRLHRAPVGQELRLPRLGQALWFWSGKALVTQSGNSGFSLAEREKQFEYAPLKTAEQPGPAGSQFPNNYIMYETIYSPKGAT